VARVVDYADVLKQVERLGLRCVYYNTGALGFPADEPQHIVGWLGPVDATIRPAMLAHAQHVEPPFPQNLAAALKAKWPSVIDGEAWLMPKSHWAFELDHGNGPWLTPALTAIGVDAENLRPRTDAAAIVFQPGEAGIFPLIERLLENLKQSDFAILFPDHRTLLTIHHHQQLWWQMADVELAGRLKL
jgi:hypothetical protein